MWYITSGGSANVGKTPETAGIALKEALVLIKHTPKKGAKIVVAMSGGVDSSVTAAWLKTMGYKVIGVSLQLHDMSSKALNTFGTCCSLSDVSDARRVAEMMDFPFYVANMEKEFEASVIDDFIKEYLNGRTPNPCVRCNEAVKFRKLLNWALDLGADYLATGHYANIRYNDETQCYELARAADATKDQTYFLFVLKQEDLRHTVFPLGEFTKDHVRQLAAKMNLPVSEKPDSQEICFVEDQDYAGFIGKKVAPSLLVPGRIVDLDGRELGRHEGIHHFTIGQRKGLRIASKTPLFVVEIRFSTGDVVVGPEEALFSSSCVVSRLNWILPPELHHPPKLTAKIRYRAPECAVEVAPLMDNRVEVRFEQPLKSVTPGQALVFYRGDRCIGGGWIEKTARE